MTEAMFVENPPTYPLDFQPEASPDFSNAFALADEVAALFGTESLTFSAAMNGMEKLVCGLDEAFRELPLRDFDDLTAMLRNHRVFPLVLEDPTTGRSFRRPRGYPGDAALIDLIYATGKSRGALAATNQTGRFINRYTYHSPSCAAVRERRQILAEYVRVAAKRQDKARVLSIAAGHLREAMLLEPYVAAGLGEWIAIDQDVESVAEIDQASYSPTVHALPLSLRDLFRAPGSLGEFDLVYAAGLYDYLDDAVAKKLTKLAAQILRPGGVMLFANFVPGRKDEAFMRVFMNWQLVYRDEAAMRRLCEDLGAEYSVECFFGANREIVYAQVSRS